MLEEFSLDGVHDRSGVIDAGLGNVCSLRDNICDLLNQFGWVNFASFNLIVDVKEGVNSSIDIGLTCVRSEDIGWGPCGWVLSQEAWNHWNIWLILEVPFLVDNTTDEVVTGLDLPLHTARFDETRKS